jgi:hypothetical protein
VRIQDVETVLEVYRLNMELLKELERLNCKISLGFLQLHVIYDFLHVDL